MSIRPSLPELLTRGFSMLFLWDTSGWVVDSHDVLHQLQSGLPMDVLVGWDWINSTFW